MIPFDEACAALDEALRGAARGEIVAAASASGDFGEALLNLRDGMRSDAWTAGGRPLGLDRFLKSYDRATRREGFHVLHDWDGIADKVNEDTIPVDVLHYVRERRGGDPVDRAALAIMLDYYFAHVLALLSVRIFDTGDPDANLDRVNGLLDALQGADGSGQRFAADAETLILIATSHFELQEIGYGRLLERVRGLNAPHRANIAIGHAASIGSHLRFGFEATYARDTLKMRDDNVADYPWLCFALVGVMREYLRLRATGAPAPERARVVEAMLNGLSADARAFVGTAPSALASPSLGASDGERAEFRDAFQECKRDLLDEFEPHRPDGQTYSPLAFFFNFSHNVVKGTVVDALLRGQPWAATLNDLLSGVAHIGSELATRADLANTLMKYARANPNRIRGRLMPVIVYDPQAGRRAFAIAMQKLTE
ncbi:MAG TPA: hypothetical protein VGJ29_14335 [Vicinamibacterales bacterium]